MNISKKENIVTEIPVVVDRITLHILLKYVKFVMNIQECNMSM